MTRQLGVITAAVAVSFACAVGYCDAWIVGSQTSDLFHFLTYLDIINFSVAAGSALGLVAFAVRIRELWNTPRTYRTDGLWGRKRQARVFRALPDHVFDTRPLHATRGPLQGRVLGGFPPADLTIYHLRMIRGEDRAARRDRYRTMDPGAVYQPGIGYDYLTDESGLALAPVRRRRRFIEEGT